MQKILIVGSTSAIAEQTARLFAERGDRLYLLARNEERLSVIASDLKIRGAESVQFRVFEANDYEQQQFVLAHAIKALEGVDVILIAYGTLPDQNSCEWDFELMKAAFNTNAISTISILTYLANHLESQGKGTIVVIGSVAGDRGRQSNYVYGTAKGMLSIFLQGLRNRLYRSGVHVLTVKPGLVDTPMTADFNKGLLWAKPIVVARCILQGIRKRRNEIYTPFYWRYIMLIIRCIPESIFKKLKL